MSSNTHNDLVAAEAAERRAVEALLRAEGAAAQSSLRLEKARNAVVAAEREYTFLCHRVDQAGAARTTAALATGHARCARPLKPLAPRQFDPENPFNVSD